MSNTDAFFSDVIQRVGGTPSAGLLATFNEWARFEGTTARYNPLATTTPMPGSTRFNGVGVQEFRTPAQGADATARTILNGYYPHIVQAIRNGVSNWHGNAAIEAEINVWGTHGFARDLATSAPDVDNYNAPALSPTVNPSPLPPAPPAPPHDPPAGAIVWVEFPGVVQVDTANVRLNPSPNAGLYREVHRGERLTFDGWCYGPAVVDPSTGKPDSRWYHISKASGYGWVASALINNYIDGKNYNPAGSHP